MRRAGCVLGRLLLGASLWGAADGCIDGDDSSSTASPGEAEMAQQIQAELDAAAHTEPATFARVRGVRPVLKCVEDLGNRHYRAHFGYDNGTAGALAIPVGFFNRFWPPPSDRGQPTAILAGKQPDVEQVPFDRGRATVWILGGHFAIATRFSRPCPANGGAGGSGSGGAAGSDGVGGNPGTGGMLSCPATCDDQIPCTLDLCGASTGFECTHVPVLDGTLCDDGNRCTDNDTCQAGVCVGGFARRCFSGDCYLDGVCDPSTGACVNPPKPDGLFCSTGNACTQGDHCLAGVCVAGPTCPPIDQCHEPGACVAGECAGSSVPRPDGTSCSLPAACGGPATCQTGVCRSAASNSACDACAQCTFGPPPGGPDVCDASASSCFNCLPTSVYGCDGITDPSDRILCQNLYACLIAPSHPGTSIPGSCLTNGDPQACWCGTHQGTCTTSNDPSTGANGPCVEQVIAAAKTDVATLINLRLIDPSFPLGRAMNLASCQENFCANECFLPSPSAPCPVIDFCHVPGVRDPVTGICHNPVAPDGTGCEDGDDCTVGDFCLAGICARGLVCPPPDPCHQAGVCDPTVRKCVDVAKPDGTACSVGPPCSGTATCQSGACRGPASADCDACNQCTFGVPPGAPDLCSSSPEGCFLCDRTVGCDGVADPGDRLLCQNLYACLIAPSHPGSNPSGSCVTSADSVECVCGPSRTCVGDDAAQAPCLVEALAAAKTTNPADILPAFNDVRLPILRAVLLAECQAHACAVECHF